MAKLKYAGTKQYMQKGFPTHTKDIIGRVICLGDAVGYDFDDEDAVFEVVFEQNSFRKLYKKWEEGVTRPELEYGYHAEEMRLKVIVKEEATYYGERVQILSVNAGLFEVRFDDGGVATIPIGEFYK